MIEIRMNHLLEALGRSYYWLAKQTGISHTTLWRLKKGKALGINFETLEKMCRTLECQPGDLLSHVNGKKTVNRRSSNEQSPKKKIIAGSKPSRLPRQLPLGR